MYSLVVSPRDLEFCDPQFLDAVDGALMNAGFDRSSVFVTSGYRVDPGSEHETGRALDIRVRSSKTRYRLVKAFLDAGFTRIGVYDGHIHVGDNGTFPQMVLWTGVSQ